MVFCSLMVLRLVIVLAMKYRSVSGLQEKATGLDGGNSNMQSAPWKLEVYSLGTFLVACCSEMMCCHPHQLIETGIHLVASSPLRCCKRSGRAGGRASILPTASHPSLHLSTNLSLFFVLAMKLLADEVGLITTTYEPK